MLTRTAKRSSRAGSGSRQTNLDNLGQLMLVDAERNQIVFGERFDATLDDIEKYLTE